MSEFEKPLNKYIDHTLLKADASEGQIKNLCDEAAQHDFASVCINSCYVSLCKDQLKNTEVKVCTVVGFPLGAMSSKAKAQETKIAVDDEADEIDMVVNVGKIKSGAWDYVLDDIKTVVEASGNALVKVIIEACLLTDDEKVKVCELAKEAGADFVKTSTGFSTGGATVEDVALMRKTVGADMGVKAAGGVRTFDAAKEMIEAGATRIGTSNGLDIVK